MPAQQPCQAARNRLDRSGAVYQLQRSRGEGVQRALLISS